MNATKYSAVDFDPSVLTFYVNMLLVSLSKYFFAFIIKAHTLIFT